MKATIRRILEFRLGDGERLGLLKRPTRRDIAQAFRWILGREAEDAALDGHSNIPTIGALRKALLDSDEFRGKYRGMHPDVGTHPNVNRDRRAVVFIHLLKTGGTTLRHAVAENFPPERCCPVLDDKLHLLSVAELSQYDFFSGHFDISCRQIIPRNHTEVFAFFREPRARLISLYRFLRAHPARDEFAEDVLIQLAHQMPAEDFFERPELRDHFTVNNHYLFAFGRSFSWFEQNRDALTQEVLLSIVPDAKAQIGGLAALGITESFDESLELICKALKLVPPRRIQPMHVTDDFPAKDSRFERVRHIDLTPKLADVMQDLVHYDIEIYKFAVQEFTRRLREFESNGG